MRKNVIIWYFPRLHINNVLLEKIPATKLLVVWLTEELSWSRNCKDICMKAYSRLSLLTTLKYVCDKIEDLLDIYTLYFRIQEYYRILFSGISPQPNHGAEPDTWAHTEDLSRRDVFELWISLRDDRTPDPLLQKREEMLRFCIKMHKAPPEFSVISTQQSDQWPHFYH